MKRATAVYIREVLAFLVVIAVQTGLMAVMAFFCGQAIGLASASEHVADRVAGVFCGVAFLVYVACSFVPGAMFAMRGGFPRRRWLRRERATGRAFVMYRIANAANEPRSEEEKEKMEIPDDITMCYYCGALHLDPDNRCPDCNAGLYYQCTGEWHNGESLDNPEFAAKAYRQEAERMRKRADKPDAAADKYNKPNVQGESLPPGKDTNGH